MLIYYFLFYFIYFSSNLYHFFLLTLGLGYSSFSSSLKCNIRLFLWSFSFSLVYAFLAINYLIELLWVRLISFVLCFHFHLSPYFLISVLIFQSTDCSGLCYLISRYHICEFSNFSPVTGFWFHTTVVRKILDIITVFLALLRLVSWLSIWFILDNVPCRSEKNVYSAAVEMFCIYVY